MSKEKTLFELIGGRAGLQKVHKIFYDKIYADPWMYQFFKDVDRQVQEDQVTDFFSGPMGGEEVYSGKFPVPAHAHIYITEELFELRHQLLKEALAEAEIVPEAQEKWLKMDYAFKKALVKKNFEDCVPRYAEKEVLSYPDPLKRDKKIG